MRCIPAFLGGLPAALLSLSCSSPAVDLESWRTLEAVPRPAAERGQVEQDLRQVGALRASRRLAEARSLALSLAAEHPEEGHVLVYASRAESDGLVLFAGEEKDRRDAAAASALDYAQRAYALGVVSAEANAQRAWAYGASTHLQAMSGRSAHARRTLEIANAALEADPQEATALATIAIVNLRLQTLPWIARVMATDLPESSLAHAVAYARRAVDARPSRENRLILARCLRAAGEEEEAQEVIAEALAANPAWPRDDAVTSQLQAEFEE